MTDAWEPTINAYKSLCDMHAAAQKALSEARSNLSGAQALAAYIEAQKANLEAEMPAHLATPSRPA